MKTAQEIRTITNYSEMNIQSFMDKIEVEILEVASRGIDHIQTYSFPNEIIGALAERFQKLGYEVENLNGNTMLGISWKS